jgi:hypothetical protein
VTREVSAGGMRRGRPYRGLRAAGWVFALGVCLSGLPSHVEGQVGVPEELRTHAERSGWTELTPHDEVLAFYRALARHAPEAVRLRSIGTSREGRELLAVTISRPGVAGPSDPVVRGRPIVFIGAQVHGNEQAGKEGLMLFARDLAAGGLEELTTQAVFVLVPQINPDAGEAGEWGTRTNPAGYNVNRDYSRLVNPWTYPFFRRPHRPVAPPHRDRQSEGGIVAEQVHVALTGPPLCRGQDRGSQQLHERMRDPVGVAIVHKPALQQLPQPRSRAAAPPRTPPSAAPASSARGSNG